jgi:hypothetical protein
MDGRAQAAYEPEAYEVWQKIMFGGPPVHSAAIRKTTPDYTKVGQWIDRQLKHDVWVVLMPANQFDKPFVRGLEHNPDWPVVFLNNEQKLFVDITTPQGKQLFEGIFTGKTLYPDDFSKNLIQAHYLLLAGRTEADHKKGLALAIKAFQLNPSQVPMQKIIYATRFPELRVAVYNFCKGYFDDFVENKNRYARKHGYHNRIVAALLAANYLQRIAEKQEDTKLVEFFAAKKQEYQNERRTVVKTKRW